LIPPSWHEEVNSLLNLSLPQNPNPPLNQKADQFITETGTENGWTKIDTVNGSEIEVCQNLDLNAFEVLFLDVLNGRK